MDDQSPWSEQVQDSQDYSNDANELWQDIDEEGHLPASWVPRPRIPVPIPSDIVAATALLARFRPARMSTNDLQELLNARADPNVTLYGDISPLMKVMTFASAAQVGQMRELLLSAGAIESREDRNRWMIRNRADQCEEAWMRNFHCDPR